MLSIIAAVYAGGSFCIYAYFMFKALSSQPPNLHREVELFSEIIPLMSEEYSIIEIDDEDTIEWDSETQNVDTFKEGDEESKEDGTEQQIPTSINLPKRKNVRFSSKSLVHSTFAPEDYTRANWEWRERKAELDANEDELGRILWEVEKFKREEMETIKNDDSTDENN